MIRILAENSTTEVSERDETALVICLLRWPPVAQEITLEPADFCNIGCGETFELIRHLGEDLTMEDLKTHLKGTIGEEVNPAAIIGEWLTTFVDHWYWPYYQKRVAQHSHRRMIADLATSTHADLRDTTLSSAELMVRNDERYQRLAAHQERLGELL